MPVQLSPVVAITLNVTALSINIYHFPLPFLSQAWDTKNKGWKNHILYHD